MYTSDMLHIETNKKWEAGWCRQVTRGKKASVKRRQGTSPKIQPQKQDASLSLLRSPSPAIALDFRANVRIPGSLLHTPSNIDISPVCTHFRCVRGDSRSRPSKTSSEIIHNSPWESERPSLPPSLPPSQQAYIPIISSPIQRHYIFTNKPPQGFAGTLEINSTHILRAPCQ